MDKEPTDTDKKKRRKKQKKRLKSSFAKSGSNDKRNVERAAPIETAHSTSEIKASVDNELEEMLSRLRQMDEDLKGKVSRICEITGMTRKEVNRYIENPDNFTNFEWEEVQKEKKVLEERIYAAIGIKAKKTLEKQKKKKITKERRGKTLGGRKGWIPM